MVIAKINMAGQYELDIKLGKLMEGMSDLRKPFQTVGYMIRDDAKNLCPVKTGNLQGSIRYENLTNTSSRIGTDVTYSIYPEFGHGNPEYRKPYLFPAWLNNLPYIITAISEYHKSLIDYSINIKTVSQINL